ncbi:A disintegrin and metalloproteinase with thrombospondin motifs 10 [Acipenser ruthenus]|uniref:A disintegrin and metalloproteinase with thrombospondin motifs 10 n=1 Tax=Acipenser ruthenus TaxID=7906 RepID=A0A662YLJ2_ACIRT|nr:A disintegrin and metalloproteinase with thrombospondin motifs 10 [Acipenser ruthenus]
MERQLFYSVAAPRTNFLLNLTLHSGLLSDRFRVEYWKRGRLAWSHRYSPHCHYVGHILQQRSSSKVALSNCNGLRSGVEDMLGQRASAWDSTDASISNHGNGLEDCSVLCDRRHGCHGSHRKSDY